MQVQVGPCNKLQRDRELVEPYPKPERRLIQLRREGATLYHIQQVQQAEGAPAEMAVRPVREVVIPLTTNVTSNIRRLKPRGNFELKQNMV